jgi:hypothetical protein
MTINAEALRTDAAEISRERVTRTRRRLRTLSARELRTVEETAEAVGQAVAVCLLESAASDASLAAVLAELYPVGNGTARG